MRSAAATLIALGLLAVVSAAPDNFSVKLLAEGSGQPADCDASQVRNTSTARYARAQIIFAQIVNVRHICERDTLPDSSSRAPARSPPGWR